MDGRKLRYFVAVAEELHLGRAAARLNMAQPPLTRQIQQLEADMGGPLFLRTSRGVQLTNSGHVLLDEARNLLRLAGRATERTRLANLGRWGRLDVGVFGSNMLAMPELLATFRTHYPDVEIGIHAMNKGEQLQGLRDGRITIGFSLLGLNLAGISNEKVRSEHLVLALRDDDPLAARDAIALNDVAEYRFVTSASGPRPNLLDFVFALCLEAGFQPRVSQEVTDSVTAVTLVAAGLGIALVPASLAYLKLPRVAFRPIKRHPPPTVDLHSIYRSDDKSPILHALLDTVRQIRTGESS